MPDDLDNLLRPRPGSQSSGDLLARTTRIIRHRARWRKTMKAGGFVAILLTGMAMGWLAKPERVPPRIEATALVPAPPAINDGSTYVTLTADQWEQRAELSDDEKDVAKFYKLAGDAHLARQRYDEAMRCYRLHVAAGHDTSLDRDDSWLLCSVKTSSHKE